MPDPFLYLVSPRPHPYYATADVIEACGMPSGIALASLPVATVAALVPDGLGVEVCDESAQPVDFDTAAPFVGITGNIGHLERMVAVAREFRRRGKVVVLGGPYVSLAPERFADEGDVLVLGELETCAGDLFADLRAGRWKERYHGDKADLDRSPLPRWDLYPHGRALMGMVQTSRGCPFECEFCDVITLLGRRQRHKPIGRVVEELDQLYRLGWRTTFITDDNFTVERRVARDVLEAIREWNARRPAGRMTFGTQISVDATADAGLLEAAAAAGLSRVFIGIETPSEDSLKETRKRQNVGVDLVARLERLAEFGIQPISGMIVGFDADGPDVFERQLHFAQASPVPIYTLNALIASEGTPLRERLRREGRLRSFDDLASHGVQRTLPWVTNIALARMTAEQLATGMRWLLNRLYAADAFGERLLRFLSLAARRPGARDGLAPLRGVEANAAAVVRGLRTRGPAERRLFDEVQRRLARHPHLAAEASSAMFVYAQVRHMLDHAGAWDEGLQRQPDPWARSVVPPAAVR